MIHPPPDSPIRATPIDTSGRSRVSWNGKSVKFFHDEHGNWIGKAILTPVVFLAVGFAVKEKESSLARDVAWYSSLSSLVVIGVFYILQFAVA